MKCNNNKISSIIPTGIRREGLSWVVGFFDLLARWTKPGSKTSTSELIFFLSFFSSLWSVSGFWRLLTWQQRCNFCQTYFRVVARDSPMCSTWRTIDNQRFQWFLPFESKIMTLMSKSSTFFCRVGNNPYPKAGLCLLSYQDRSPWILILPSNSLLFALRF